MKYSAFVAAARSALDTHAPVDPWYREKLASLGIVELPARKPWPRWTWPLVWLQYRFSMWRIARSTRRLSRLAFRGGPGNGVRSVP